MLRLELVFRELSLRYVSNSFRLSADILHHFYWVLGRPSLSTTSGMPLGPEFCLGVICLLPRAAPQQRFGCCRTKITESPSPPDRWQSSLTLPLPRARTPGSLCHHRHNHLPRMQSRPTLSRLLCTLVRMPPYMDQRR